MTAQITDYLAGLDHPLRDVAAAMRPVIESALPGTTGVLYHGHPVWGLGEHPGRRPVCLLKAYPAYVTFGLWRGQDVTDPSGRLTPGARRMASVKLATADDIDPDLFTGWLRAALDLESR
ncbi:hypothetical protein Cme02nite_65060 [Catellatospora methionotrophica]|uniref:YdhG-like domain-containing protein n=1 Tax=Catellatospora methionotrophica TaxID=121620 RepID=A0A8J3LMA1_9ACTN|nr:DUF1801 domain-containing protein [Catellatospora methionotrophica]GIG18174.1 hypothetical protein Cme02nite_65060 [Catellatospora methionotrophica]